MRAATTGRPAAHRAVGRVRPIAATRVAPMRIEDYAAIVDGCPGGEGAFVAAGFWLAQVALVNVRSRCRAPGATISAPAREVATRRAQFNGYVRRTARASR
ncbi:hypothetical protein BGV71_13410 [Burkholderia ubonensis]|nr:hypothetical protein WJ81_08880 [Burkholderia ubonensis]KVP08412.1 hypothetical protein WJ84_26420 [Burkholderia ubonensis]KVZ54464.1 hypothetical protein WL20_27355 [Burkholderia ubonensis]KVZ60400.1 hypothetical protein WL21_27500 [Burkholderia ubonensis]KWE78358.1 hypothetical protein WL78_02990 [Burkholderia ubonensis]